MDQVAAVAIFDVHIETVGDADEQDPRVTRARGLDGMERKGVLFRCGYVYKWVRPSVGLSH